MQMPLIKYGNELMQPLEKCYSIIDWEKESDRNKLFVFIEKCWLNDIEVQHARELVIKEFGFEA